MCDWPWNVNECNNEGKVDLFMPKAETQEVVHTTFESVTNAESDLTSTDAPTTISTEKITVSTAIPSFVTEFFFFCQFEEPYDLPIGIPDKLKPKDQKTSSNMTLNIRAETVKSEAIYLNEEPGNQSKYQKLKAKSAKESDFEEHEEHQNKSETSNSSKSSREGDAELNKRGIVTRTSELSKSTRYSDDENEDEVRYKNGPARPKSFSV